MKKKSTNIFENNKAGFTLAELLVSSTISLLVVVAGFTLINIAFQSNKKDESRLNLSSKVDNSLTFILDEVKSGKSLISSTSDLSNNCKSFTGEFLFGIKLPPQAIDKSKYSNATNSWTTLNCPIVYSLRQESNKKQGHAVTYELLRKGPSINEKGFYTSAAAQTTKLTDSIDAVMIDQLNCSPSWNKRVVRGITLCIDSDKKAVEIGISAKNTITPVLDVTTRKTSGSFSRIVDSEIMGDVFSFGNSAGQGSACNSGCSCNLFGTQIVSNRVTFSIDTSGSMSWGKINGKMPMEAAKDETIKMLNCLKDGVKLQVIGFNHTQSYCFPNTTTVTSSTRNQAINCVSKMRAWGGTSPWGGLTKAVQDKNVGQVILLSDGWTNTSGYCFHTRRYEPYADCYQKYNADIRDKDQSYNGKVRFDTLSIGNNFCSGSGWLGQISSKNEGNCTLIK